MTKRFLKILYFFLLFFVLGIGYYFIYTHTQFQYQCLIHKTTGFDCSGCGISRMCVAILQGDFYQAFRYNAFILITFPFLACVLLGNIYGYIRYGFTYRILDRILLIYAFLLIAFGILRNIGPFTYFLATTVY